MPSVEFEGRGPARVVTLKLFETAYLTDSPTAMALGADRQDPRQSEQAHGILQAAIAEPRSGSARGIPIFKIR